MKFEQIQPTATNREIFKKSYIGCYSSSYWLLLSLLTLLGIYYSNISTINSICLKIMKFEQIQPTATNREIFKKSYIGCYSSSDWLLLSLLTLLGIYYSNISTINSIG